MILGHSLPGVVCFPGKDQDALHKVVVGIAFVGLSQWPGNTSSFWRFASTATDGSYRRSDGYWETLSRWPPPPPPLPPLLFTSASQTGCRAHLQDLTVAGIWSLVEKDFHINIMEIKAVQLAQNVFLSRMMGESVVLMSDNVTHWWFISTTRIQSH